MEKIKIYLEDLNDITSYLQDEELIEKYSIEFDFSASLNNGKINVYYDFGSAYYDTNEVDEYDELEEIFENVSKELEERLNDLIAFLNYNIDIIEIELNNNIIKITTNKVATKELLKEIENECEYVEKIESEYVNKIIKLQQENKQLQLENEKLKKASEDCLDKLEDKGLFNAISNMYGFSLGIYDSKGNKVSDGYSPILPEKRIGSLI